MATLLALLCFLTGAYGLLMSREAAALRRRLDRSLRLDTGMLESVRILTAAARESTHAVLDALEGVLRAIDPRLDAILVFLPEGEHLRCARAMGRRAEHFEGVRLRLDDRIALPARAALSGHRVELSSAQEALIPTDRAAIAVPMRCGDALTAVVYAATPTDRVAEVDAVVTAIAQAASPYALAAEREADRAHATYDALTGLFTPRAFRERLARDVAVLHCMPARTLSVWFIDTDHFKCVNDSLGHAAGDVVLQRMAALLREHLAQPDLAARNGGDEFCAIVRDVPKVEAIERAQRFCEAVRNCDFGPAQRMSASIGVATYPYDALEASELLEAADAAMYHSKRAGRNRVSFRVGPASFSVYE